VAIGYETVGSGEWSVNNVLINDQCLSDLLRARELILRGWCKYNRAVNTSGNHIEPWNRNAVAWCALGAIDAVLGRYVDEYDCPVRDLAKHITDWRGDSAGPICKVADYNNMSDKESVITLFDAAIAGHMIGVGFAHFAANRSREGMLL